MRIVEIETFGRGGLVHYAYNLSCALAARGHQVTLVTAASYELAGRPAPANLDVVTPIGRISHGMPRSWPHAAVALATKLEVAVDAARVARLVRKLRPDVAHLHSTNASALAYLTLLRALGIPVVTTAHVVTAHERSRLQDGAARRIHALGNHIVAHSAHDESRLIEEFAIPASKVTVIPHGEYGFFSPEGTLPDRGAARQRLGLAQDDEVALFFGHIREYKGLDLLLQAWPGVARARPRARLVVAGDPSRLDSARRAELEAWAGRLGAVRRFEYIPFTDVAAYFAAADVLVMPYRHISQSGVLFLALSVGVPVVATRVGGLQEILVDGVNALLVPPESPASVEAAVSRALGDPDLRRRLSTAGRELAGAHGWPAIAARTEALFTRLLGRRAEGQAIAT